MKATAPTRPIARSRTIDDDVIDATTHADAANPSISVTPNQSALERHRYTRFRADRFNRGQTPIATQVVTTSSNSVRFMSFELFEKTSMGLVGSIRIMRCSIRT